MRKITSYLPSQEPQLQGLQGRSGRRGEVPVRMADPPWPGAWGPASTDVPEPPPSPRPNVRRQCGGWGQLWGYSRLVCMALKRHSPVLRAAQELDGERAC